MYEYGTYLQPEYKKRSGTPRTVGEYTFRPYGVGIMLSAWISDCGQARVDANSGYASFTVRVRGECIGRLFRTLDTSMKAAVRVLKKPPNRRGD